MKTITLFAAAVLALTGCGSDYGDGGSSSSGNGGTIATAKNDQLGKTVLVDGNGMTLYALSAEKGGKFVCTDTKCLSAWKPVGGKPEGDIDSLSTVKRPDGRQQVTYKGAPLYTFASDSRKGDAKG